jgi:hypothetical protein
MLEKVKRHGLKGSATRSLILIRWHLEALRKQYEQVRKQYELFRLRNAPRYANPSPSELEGIESDLKALGIKVFDYYLDPHGFQDFVELRWFPVGYHGGINSGVWYEKILEHYIAKDLIGLDSYNSSDIYVDIAASNSPWATILREKLEINAYAIDLSPVPEIYKSLPYYKSEDATHSSFPDQSVKGASLQCAYEMFTGDSDIKLIHELKRILAPGGKVVIAPLYTHTHYCAYSTPEYFGKGYSDPVAKEYLRDDCYGITSSRKYDATELKKRVLDPIATMGMSYRLLALRNKQMLGEGIYCHFVLEIKND